MGNRTKVRYVSDLRPGPVISDHKIEHSDIHRLLQIDGMIVRFTVSEYQVIKMMLWQKEGTHVTLEQFAETIYNCELDDLIRKSLGRRVSSIRAKLWPFGINILCSNRWGYTYSTKPQYGQDAESASENGRGPFFESKTREK